MSDLKKTTITIPRTLHRAARIKAAQEDIRLRDVVIRALEWYVSQPLSLRPEGPAKRVGKFPVLSKVSAK